jgi:hypothetical protein
MLACRFDVYEQQLRRDPPVRRYDRRDELRFRCRDMHRPFDRWSSADGKDHHCCLLHGMRRGGAKKRPALRLDDDGPGLRKRPNDVRSGRLRGWSSLRRHTALRVRARVVRISAWHPALPDNGLRDRPHVLWGCWGLPRLRRNRLPVHPALGWDVQRNQRHPFVGVELFGRSCSRGKLRHHTIPVHIHSLRRCNPRVLQRVVHNGRGRVANRQCNGEHANHGLLHQLGNSGAHA